MKFFAQVLVTPLNHALTYEIPEDLVEQVSIGQKVEVPLGNRYGTGFVASISNDIEIKEQIKIKELKRLIGDCPCFNQEQLNLFEWVANYHNQPLSSVIDTAIPSLTSPRYDKRIVLAQPYLHSSLRGSLQQAIIAELVGEKGASSYQQLISKHKGASSCIKNLEKKGILVVEKTERSYNSLNDEAIPNWTKLQVDLNAEQKVVKHQVIDAAEHKNFEAILLHGITGSGKTEVYIEAIHHLLRQKRGSLILVPEIALTPQLMDRFRTRLGNQIAILHSALSKSERWNYWRALIRNEIFIAVGARSAIFAPVPNLGLIIVDEEHDPSYKQAEGLRYNARDLAIVRSKLNHCPVLLGSATPSLESFSNALRKRYSYLPLKQRHGAAQRLQIDCVDLNQLKQSDMKSPNISNTIYNALEHVLKQRQQAFILYNRRGFASYMQCVTCQESIVCPNCSVTLTFHQSKQILLCHYCNYRMAPPPFCPKCQSIDKVFAKTNEQSQKSNPTGKLIRRGGGTEKVYEELNALFSEARIARLDRDTADNHRDYKRILNQLRSGEFDILVGTQMIAKGHDLPGVTLVGVVDCDVGLHFPDFRGAERVFQLLTQAAGRAGRADESGRVILQTRSANHHSLVHTIRQNYNDFAKEELALRRETGYPPFSRLLRVIASSEKGDLASSILQALAGLARSQISAKAWSVSVLGPAPAPIEKVKKKYRWHLLLKSKQIQELLSVRNLMQKNVKGNSKVHLVFDIDPQDML